MRFPVASKFAIGFFVALLGVFGAIDAKASCHKLMLEFFSAGQSPLQLASISPSISPSGQLSYSQTSYTPLYPLFNRQREEIEKTLMMRDFQIVKTHRPFDGINFSHQNANLSYKVQLDQNVFALWKPHTETWHSNYRAEVLAYEMDQLLGLNLVPPTVAREFNGEIGSLQLWVEASEQNNLLPSGQLNKQSFFDYVIENGDRHPRNFLASFDHQRVISIDHGISFTGQGYYLRSYTQRRNEIESFFSTTEGQAALERLMRVDQEVLQRQLIDYLGPDDAGRVLERINFIIETFGGALDSALFLSVA